jgi:hypothetical protein
MNDGDEVHFVVDKELPTWVKVRLVEMTQEQPLSGPVPLSQFLEELLKAAPQTSTP